MASFTISIELNDSSPAAHRHLRTIMNKQGFRHSVDDRQGMHYRLPRDEYIHVSYETRHELLERVCKILEGVEPVPGVLITEAVGRAWRDLKEIDLS